MNSNSVDDGAFREGDPPYTSGTGTLRDGRAHGAWFRLVTIGVGMAIGAVITPVAAMLAIVSGGAGHGHYEFARLFFPYTMLLTRVADNRITIPLIVLALAQFPIYGALVGICGRKIWLGILIGGLLLAAHVIAAALCFSGLIPNFS